MEPTYKLILYLGNDTKDYLALTFDTAGNSELLGCKFILTSLNIKKEIYTPGLIEAELQTSLKENNSGIIPDISQFNVDSLNSLLGKKATLNDGANDIAKDYIIFDFIPEYRADGNKTSLYVKLLIYSPEKILSFKKYNKCYVSKKLGKDIFQEIAAKYPTEIKQTNIDYLQHLIIKNSDGDCEFIQPYLVQYDESALDFLTRIANRCGEFMFYENGVWQLGFNTAQSVEKIDKYTSLSFHRFKDREEENYRANNYFEKSTEKKKAEKGADIQTYNGPADEHLATYEEKKTDYGESLKKQYDFKAPSFYLKNLTSWMAKDDATSIISSVAVDLAKNSIKTGTHYKESTEKWNKAYIDPYKKEESQEHSTNGKNGTIVSPFSNYDAIQHFTYSFYTSVKKHEQEVERQAIHISLGTNYQSLLLGNILEVLGKKYIITRITITCNKKTVTNADGKPENKQYTTFDIDAIPLLPSSDKKELCFPSPIKNDTIKKIESQTAIVTSTSDPFKLGRIQIRYPWQDEASNPSSPWIRIAAPFTSKGAALKFMPQKGDEIMVGYEYGDIERPFMIGSLTSAANNGDNNDYILKSPNGHYIKFSNPSNWKDLAKSFSPAINTWLSYLPTSADYLNFFGKAGKELAGGITLGDTYGFYNISMSTEKRSISIASSLGDVKIDALTGITISAPNGNVKIVGKNVEISAGNNLKITSGTNVKKIKAYQSLKNLVHSSKANLVGGIVKEIKSATQVIDFTLIRTITEAFIKPIGGTMLIKSNRFLRLEAGKGTTKLPNTAFKQNSDKEKGYIRNKLIELRVKDTINATLKLMNYYIEIYDSTLKSG